MSYSDTARERIAERQRPKTLQEGRLDVLASAEADGRISFWTLKDRPAGSAIMGMFIEGLITRRCRPDKAGPWLITEAGRTALTSASAHTKGDAEVSLYAFGLAFSLRLSSASIAARRKSVLSSCCNKTALMRSKEPFGNAAIIFSGHSIFRPMRRGLSHM